MEMGIPEVWVELETLHPHKLQVLLTPLVPNP